MHVAKWIRKGTGGRLASARIPARGGADRCHVEHASMHQRRVGYGWQDCYPLVGSCAVYDWLHREEGIDSQLDSCLVRARVFSKVADTRVLMGNRTLDWDKKGELSVSN